MIISGLFSFLLAIAGALLGLLPDGDALGLTVPSGIVVGYTWANTFLPLTEVFAALATYLGVYMAILGVQSIRAVLRHVPFVGG